MKIHTIVQRELSKTEKQTIAHFCYYFDDKACFALLGDYTIVALSAENACDLELLRQEALENMETVRNTPPDFQTYVMDDSFGLVAMNAGVYGVTPEQLTDEEVQAGRMGVATALGVRGQCLELCHAGEIIAFNLDAR